MELQFLYYLQSLHTPALDSFMTTVFSTLVGSKGEIWIILGILLIVFPKTRKTGVLVLASYIVAYFIGDGILKNLIARPRPCTVDETVELLVSRSTSYSCPSVHSMLAFASASAIAYNHRKAGIAAMIFALLIGFSRLYFFVHYPTDVLLGAILGALIGFTISYLCRNWSTVHLS